MPIDFIVTIDKPFQGVLSLYRLHNHNFFYIFIIIYTLNKKKHLTLIIQSFYNYITFSKMLNYS